MQIKITSEIMKNDWASDFLKAIQYSITIDDWVFIGIGGNGFICQKSECLPSFDMIFEFEKLKIDWRNISDTPIQYYIDDWYAYDGYDPAFHYTIDRYDPVGKNEKEWILDFRWLNEQEGIEVIGCK